jgi:8-oxo-dGTP pyrophosphatase MutT (NUDIX family)
LDSPDVPPEIRRTAEFQRWYATQQAAGNTLLGARVVWTFHVGRQIFYWALHVRIHVRAEDRIKDNEVVLSRPDVAAVVLYRPGRTRDDTTVVLVREFRSAASVPGATVHELPGGSGPGSPGEQAVAEVAEETGLSIDAGRLRSHGGRPVAATMSAHHAHLFSAELTEEELAWLRAESGPRGVAADSERTWIEVTTYGEIREARLVDWTTLGMLAQVLP